MGGKPEAEKERTNAYKDLLVFSFIFIALVFAVYFFDFFGPVLEVVERQEHKRFDELVFLFMFLALFFCIFSVRRWMDVKSEMARRKEADLQLRMAEESLMFANEKLRIELVERRRMDEVLKKTNEELTAKVERLNDLTEEITVVGQMGDMFLASQGIEDVYDVISRYGGRLFHGDAGAVFTYSSSRNILELSARWGENDECPSEIYPENCWALRKGKCYSVEDVSEAPRCRNLKSAPKAGYICVPMMAHGEALGVMFLLNLSGSRGEGFNSKERLAVTVAEHMAVAVSAIKMRETLRIQSIRDPLTGLFNRRFMEESLDREIHRTLRSGKTTGIVFLDIDRFKEFNDSHGHSAGDSLLCELGLFLKANIRGGDIACRYGGEEFVIVFADSPLDDTLRRAEQIREGVGGLRIVHAGKVVPPISISAGVAAFPVHGPSADAVIKAADAAMYKAKAEGRNRVAVAHFGEESMGLA